ncbi:MAG TPA: hypothetical protein VGO58_07385 [Chitinophagaceae bacterium]|jgi:hypothetical protein|nr:hypothetical protein [Chitinophagaceae bacterium]
MKNRDLSHSHQAAKIYRHYYKSSVNPFRLLKSILIVFISGRSTAARSYYRRGR